MRTALRPRGGKENRQTISTALALVAAAAVFLLALAACDEQNRAFPVDVETETGAAPPGQPGPQAAPLVVAWEYVPPGGEHADFNEIGSLPALQVLSPTWFHLVDREGTIESRVDRAYLKWARNCGYEVWALATNSFDAQITAEVLSCRETRSRVAADLVELSVKHGLDGLNIDFENFHSDHRDQFTSFIGELSLLCREKNLVLSVDVTMVSGAEYWSLCYDRAALAAEADYIILMAYDEHYKSSPRAGSVSSLPWVERGIKRVLGEVPADQLILGVPFYVRLFEVDESGAEPVVTNSWSYSIPEAEKLAAENEAEIFFDPVARQSVARYFREGLTYIMWMEDRASMEERLELARDHGLAGIAAWRRGLETPEIWAAIESYVQKSSAD